MTTKEFFNTYAKVFNRGLFRNGLAEISAPISSTGIAMYSSVPFFLSKIKSGDAVLELGCGKGELAVELPHDVDYTGVDFSEEMLSYAPKETSNVSFLCEDYHNLSFEKDSFDVVIANESLPYSKDIARAHEEISRVLKPSGKFYSKMFLYRDDAKLDNLNDSVQGGIRRMLGLENDAFGFKNKSKYTAELEKFFVWSNEIGVETHSHLMDSILRGVATTDPDYFPNRNILLPNSTKQELQEAVYEFFKESNFLYSNCAFSAESLFSCSKK